MNHGLTHLQAYPFERLAEIQSRVQPPAGLRPINMSIGEPQHPTPAFIHEALVGAIAGTGKYPATRGTAELRQAMCAWLERRFALGNGALDPERHVLPVNGTRESLFAITQCIVDSRHGDAVVAMPNPFYQIYEGAALLAGARPAYIPCPSDRGFLPAYDLVDDDVWDRCQLLYLCTPGNPSGRVMSVQDLGQAIDLAHRHDFIIVSDECYSELYLDEAQAPVGLLEAAARLGVGDFSRCLVMHSLSKRSNAPGLRSGFVAGDPALIAAFLRYRTYHGSAMSLFVQAASVAAWRDEDHVRANRALYREKFRAVLPILRPWCEIPEPQAGFYLWPKVPLDDVECCTRLIAEQNVITLPGRFLARDDATGNPGRDRIRIVLTGEIDECVEGAERIARLLGA